ncbi:MAG: MBL fold metallo-hydrolase [Deltaproteobacteria bacterium]|nr:MBL fold metallo-hydrolase [Deltaproteobacteria bacterium]
MPTAKTPPIVRQLEVGSMRNFAYLIGDREGGTGAVIDPAAEYDRIAAEAARHRLELAYVINTHSHHDHIGGNGYFRKAGAKLVAHAQAPTKPDVPVAHRDQLPLGSLSLQVVYTPGHTADGICVVADGYVFTGDTLFIGECGRVDLPGADVAAMYHSLLTVLYGLPDELVVMPGHNYGPLPQRTLGEEKRDNYTLKRRTLQEFTTFMGAP